MAHNLVIVESPAKTKTISKYLGKDYKVMSSKGHIRDLATKGKYGLGVDIDNHFAPMYTTIRGKKSVIDELKREAKSADTVYLATDPDREGEAISWHLYDALKLSDDKYKRIVFNEITKNAVTSSIAKARKIDQNLVNSQEARRILDRIIGFRLSKLIQSKTTGTSAGRVQSVALKLIVDKEREISAFKSEEYWKIMAEFNDFTADLAFYNHEKIEISSEDEANKIIESLGDEFVVESIEKKKKNKNSPFPFTTSTLQQAASSKLNMSAKKTMSVAQKLYEGIELETETVGLITYMRTDSTRLSLDFINECNKYILDNYGKDYLGVVKKSKKTENVQDAHEAIRPTSINRTPESVKPYLTGDEYKLYKIIYYRALASLLAPAKTENTTILLNNNNYGFKATGQVIVFPGYLKVYDLYEQTTDKILPVLDQTKPLVASDIVKEQHFTQPPARYTEASLVKAMEELGIGRPSTYATIMSNIKDRGYVNIVEKKFIPTEIGIEVNDSLQAYFSNIINVKYTANMENDLDKIAMGEKVWYVTLEEFYHDFEPLIQDAFDKMEKKAPEETGEVCPNCGKPLVIRKGRYGNFTACSGYPECKYVKVDPSTIKEICKCPNCDGMIVEKKSKRGKVFYGCNNYPSCKTAYWDKPTGELCPKCNKMLTEKNGKIKCSECDFEK